MEECIRKHTGNGGSYLGQLGAVAHDVFVGSDKHIELQAGNFHTVLAGTLVLVAHIVHALCAGQPCCQLALPVDHHSIGHDDQMGPVIVLVLHEVRDQRHDLRGWSLNEERLPAQELPWQKLLVIPKLQGIVANAGSVLECAMGLTGVEDSFAIFLPLKVRHLFAIQHQVLTPPRALV